MRLLRLRSFVATATLATTLFAPRAHAIWPPSPEMSAEDLSRPENWPNDPGYAYTERGGGQWSLWSWIPMATRAVASFRAQELTLGAGNSVDRAWGGALVLIVLVMILYGGAKIIARYTGIKKS